jgi:tagaturonate reductase
MNKLSKELIKTPENISNQIKVGSTKDMPIKVLQFGEGNFLRGFVDWMFNKLNNENLFNGKIAVAQPIENGLVNLLNEQDGLYTLLLRGLQNKELISEKELITSVEYGLNLYKEYDKFIDLVKNPELKVIVSNTTEAGIEYNENDKLNDRPQKSFPGKLTAFLYKRFQAFEGDKSKGFIILPCELIDRNGDNLKKIVLKYAKEWHLGNDFIDWMNNSNHFLNTLVDRIVTGYPRDEIELLTKGLGYEDKLIDTGEIFHLWVIEGDINLSKELPFDKVGLNVVWTNDLTPYRTRKVRILNGAHTMTVLAAYLYGLNTVKECIDDSLILSYMKKGIFDEVIPTLNLSKEELTDFASSVIERFANPYIKHNLLSISLNSVSKFKTRVLPSLLEYINAKNELPIILTFSLASLIAFYKGTEINGDILKGKREQNEYSIKDNLEVLNFFKDIWSEYNESKNSIDYIVKKILENESFWGKNLNEIPNLNTSVSTHLYNILSNGMEESIKNLLA